MLSTAPLGVTRRMQAAGFRAAPYATQAREESATTPAPVTAAHGMTTPTTAVPAPAVDKSDRILEMLTAMQKENEKKDAMIAQLQEVIKGLNAQLESMKETMTKSQAQQPQPHHAGGDPGAQW